MPKFLTRIAAVLLVPCLIADPTLAVSISRHSFFEGRFEVVHDCQLNQFQEEALAARSGVMPSEHWKQNPTVWVFSLAAAALMVGTAFKTGTIHVNVHYLTHLFTQLLTSRSLFQAMAANSQAKRSIVVMLAGAQEWYLLVLAGFGVPFRGWMNSGLGEPQAGNIPLAYLCVALDQSAERVRLMPPVEVMVQLTSEEENRIFHLRSAFSQHPEWLSHAKKWVELNQSPSRGPVTILQTAASQVDIAHRLANLMHAALPPEEETERLVKEPSRREWLSAIGLAALTARFRSMTRPDKIRVVFKIPGDLGELLYEYAAKHGVDPNQVASKALGDYLKLPPARLREIFRQSQDTDRLTQWREKQPVPDSVSGTRDETRMLARAEKTLEEIQKEIINLIRMPAERLLAVLHHTGPTSTTSDDSLPPAAPTHLHEILDLHPFKTDNAIVLAGHWDNKPWFVKVNRGENAEQLGLREKDVRRELMQIPDIKRHMENVASEGVLSAEDVEVMEAIKARYTPLPVNIWDKKNVDEGIARVLLHGIDMRELEGKPFLTMQGLEGQSAKDQIDGLRSRSNELPDAEKESLVLSILMAIGEAITDLHRHGVAHRDLSPGEVFLAPEEHGMWHVRFADFGLSTTPRYPLATMPEDWRLSVKESYGNANLEEPQRDVYSLMKIAAEYTKCLSRGSVVDLWLAELRWPVIQRIDDFLGYVHAAQQHVGEKTDYADQAYSTSRQQIIHELSNLSTATAQRAKEDVLSEPRSLFGGPGPRHGMTPKEDYPGLSRRPSARASARSELIKRIVGVLWEFVYPIEWYQLMGIVGLSSLADFPLEKLKALRQITMQWDKNVPTIQITGKIPVRKLALPVPSLESRIVERSRGLTPARVNLTLINDIGTAMAEIFSRNPGTYWRSKDLRAALRRTTGRDVWTGETSIQLKRLVDIGYIRIVRELSHYVTYVYTLNIKTTSKRNRSAA